MATIVPARLRALTAGQRGRQIAERIGVSESGFSRYRSGKRDPKLSVFRRICEEMGVSADWLLGLDTVEERGQRGTDRDRERVEAAIRQLQKLLADWND